MNSHAFIVLACCCHRFVNGMAQVLPTAISNPQDVTVSGLSSGGYFSVQYHVAFSNDIHGAGIVAAGPYFCSMGAVLTAVTSCMTQPDQIQLDKLYNATAKFESQAEIDPTANLADDTVYLFSGTVDATTTPGVMHKLEKYYRHYITRGKISTKFDIAAAHGMPTLDYGLGCNVSGSPHIQKCEYDGAGQILQTLYGSLRPPVKPVPSNIVEFWQKDHGSEEALMGDTGYLYIPDGCKENSRTCRLHIAFHGCGQTAGQLGTEYVEHTGYNGWAEANHIVILYPQSNVSATNPKGCWDWWGYTGASFNTKRGLQMQAIKSMQTKLTTPPAVATSTTEPKPSSSKTDTKSLSSTAVAGIVITVMVCVLSMVGIAYHHRQITAISQSHLSSRLLDDDDDNADDNVDDGDDNDDQEDGL
eukprot:TRINITY_DN11786_c0_g7_i1.p1 TRINITY_DN11786_c0_g7~~TRINITY_DN11786_c0_g7_i1.p1  ORF type:complete len:416 (+),score=72.86 TRINITY_DN11786_c0_g7_i1:96-1343(+)